MTNIPILENPSKDQVNAILDNIANLYHDPEAIIFEYIQNSIDSALEFNKTYSKEEMRKVFVHIDEKKQRYVIQDNCMGMTTNEIEELPKNVFNSRKKKYSWVVGQFGYGIQSFRSRFEKVTISSMNINEFKNNTIIFEKGSNNAQKKQDKMLPFGRLYPSNNQIKWDIRKHGTDVIVEHMLKKDGRRTSFDYVSAKLMEKIPLHFEEYVANKQIQIIMVRWQGKRGRSQEIACHVNSIKALNYVDIPGKEFEGTVTKDKKKIAEYYFKVVDNKYLNEQKSLANYKPTFKRLGTSISSISEMTSFRKYCQESNHDLTIWSRPELIGKINITEKIDIDIDRTDISAGDDADLIFEKMVTISEEINVYLDELEKKNIESHEKQLSEIISDAFTDISKDLD